MQPSKVFNCTIKYRLAKTDIYILPILNIFFLLPPQDRCHRIGQTRPVVIFRLVTKNTIDESIVQRAQAKRAIEKLVVHEDKFKSGQASLKETANKVLTAKEIMEILLNQDDLDATEEASDDQYGLADKLLDELMDRTDIVKVYVNCY